MSVDNPEAADGGHAMIARAASPKFVAPLRELIHNIHQFGEHWSWRCGVVWSRLSPGYLDGACQYDHVVDSWEQLVADATEHLERWHGIRLLVASPEPASSAGTPEDGHTFEVTVRLRGSFAVSGEPGHHDEPEWGPPMVPQQVRAWSLVEALEMARRLPLAAWLETEEEGEPFVCQIMHVGMETLTCPARESGGYRCERTDPHGEGEHRIGAHTIAHATLGNGYACSAALLREEAS